MPQNVVPFGRNDREPSPLRRRPVVLVVHQEDSLRALVRRAIEAEGYTCLEARTAWELMPIGARSMREVDLVITDLAQPGLAGPDGLRQLLGSSTRFLYLLRSDPESFPPEEEVTFFLSNPFRGRSLEEKVRRILRG